MSAQDYARPPLRQDTRDRLRAAKEGGESFDDVVTRLLDEHEQGAER